MKRLSVLAVCLLFALPLCSEEPPKTEVPMIKVYTQPDKPIGIAVGQQFVIKLVSNPTTGYGWQLAKPLDTTVLQCVTNAYVGSDSKLCGAGGHEVWTFKAVGQGKADISMKYVRPWEKDVPADKTNVFSVIVK